MNDYEKYFNDMLKISPSISFLFGIKNKKTLSTIENNYDCNYNQDYYNILKKYINTKDYILKQIIKKELKNVNYHFDLMPLMSFENIIINFDADNKTLYPKNNLYFKMRKNDFKKKIEKIIYKMRIGLKKKITIPKIICKKVIKQLEKTSYTNLINFLKKEYYPKCRNNIGLCHLRNGKKMYKYLINVIYGIKLSPEKIHNIGKKLIKKFKNIEIEKYNNKDEILKDFHIHYDNIYNNILPKYFNYIPEKKCKIKIVPKELEKTNGLAYFNSIENKFYINFNNIKMFNKKSLKTLIMHETDPGHHYQFDYFKYKKLPLYKIYGYQNTALVEGWAFYSEKLDDNNNGTEEYNQLRIIRLVVDTGINYYGWSFKKAFNYMKKHLNINNDEIKQEIERYISIPSQALCYYIGYLNILYLKKLYIEKYKIGNIKDFHDFILKDGVVPFNYLKYKLLKLKSK